MHTKSADGHWTPKKNISSLYQVIIWEMQGVDRMLFHLVSFSFFCFPSYISTHTHAKHTHTRTPSTHRGIYKMDGLPDWRRHWKPAVHCVPMYKFRESLASWLICTIAAIIDACNVSDTIRSHMYLRFLEPDWAPIRSRCSLVLSPEKPGSCFINPIFTFHPRNAQTSAN